MQWIILLFALAAGAANPFQSGTNAELKTQLSQPIWATLWVYASGLAGVLLVQAFVRQPLPSSPQMQAVPWWAWMGGIISIAATFAGLMLAQKLGAGIFTGVSITAATVVSIALDHFGLVGFRQHGASPLRMAGGALMIAGVWMVAKF
ncbi:MAG: DMT family transporter [Janthinobacterium lividum]